MFNLVNKIFACFLVNLLFAISAGAVVVSVENNLKENESGSVLEVSDMTGEGVNKSVRVSILPGEKKKVSPRNITSFIVSRVFGDRKMQYFVQCPTDRRVKDAVTLTLDSVVKNEMPAGCIVEKKGRWTVAEGTIWEKTN